MNKKTFYLICCFNALIYSLLFFNNISDFLIKSESTNTTSPFIAENFLLFLGFLVINIIILVFTIRSFKTNKIHIVMPILLSISLGLITISELMWLIPNAILLDNHNFKIITSNINNYYWDLSHLVKQIVFRVMLYLFNTTSVILSLTLPNKNNKGLSLVMFSIISTLSYAIIYLVGSIIETIILWNWARTMGEIIPTILLIILTMISITLFIINVLAKKSSPLGVSILNILISIIIMYIGIMMWSDFRDDYSRVLVITRALLMPFLPVFGIIYSIVCRDNLYLTHVEENVIENEVVEEHKETDIKSSIQSIKELKELLDLNAITEEEYNSLKEKILFNK